MTTRAKRRPRRASARPAPPSPPWEEVVANLSDPIFLVATDGIIRACNPATEQMLGLPHGQIYGRHFAEVFGPESALTALLRRAQELHHTHAQTAESGMRGPVRIVTSPVLDPSGAAQGTVVLMHDLRYQVALQEDAERADRLARLGTVAAGLAHEIKNPLGGIKGAAQLLRRHAADHPSVCEYTDVMVREVDRLSALVEQLLDLGATGPPQFEALNIHRVIDDVLLLSREDPAVRAVAVRCEFDPSLPPVRGDGRQLTQVLLNLIKNACEAMEGRGTLVLVTRLETDFHIVRHRQGAAKFIRVEVADGGPGIRAEDLPRIFDPFFTTKSRGTGLGLALCQRIVFAHGGSLRAGPRRGGGTVMTVSLPVATEA